MSDESEVCEQLIGRLQSGDPRVLADLFGHYGPRLKRMVAIRMDARLRGRVDASDVLQEAFLDARDRIDHYLQKPELSFYVWLRQVTMQRLIDVHRRHLNAKKRDVKQELPIDRGRLSAAASTEIAEQLVGHLTSPSRHAMRAEMMERVTTALHDMDAIDREVLILRHFEELTNNEISEMLGITKAAASNRYVRALARLRDALEVSPGFFDNGGSELF